MWFFPFCQETEDERRRISGWIEWEEKKASFLFGGNRGSGFSFKGEKFHLLGENWKMWHKAPIRYSDESKSPRAALLNFRRDLFKKKKIPSSFSSSFFFSPFEWQLLLFFRNNREANSSQINVASVTTPFWAQPSPGTKAQSSEWINTQLALVKRFQNKEDGGKSDAEEVPREFAAR